MTIAAQTEAAIEGRRRADTRPGEDTVGRAPGPVATAFAELSDRHQLVEHHINDLAVTIDRLADRVRPALTDGQPAAYPEDSESPGVPAQVDNRSMVARSISSEATIADGHATSLAALTRRIEAITEALEV